MYNQLYYGDLDFLLDLKDSNIIALHRNIYPNAFNKMITEFSNNNLKFISIKYSTTSINSVLIWNKVNLNPAIHIFLNNI